MRQINTSTMGGREWSSSRTRVVLQELEGFYSRTGVVLLELEGSYSRTILVLLELELLTKDESEGHFSDQVSCCSTQPSGERGRSILRSAGMRQL